MNTLFGLQALDLMITAGAITVLLFIVDIKLLIKVWRRGPVVPFIFCAFSLTSAGSGMVRGGMIIYRDFMHQNSFMNEYTRWLCILALSFILWILAYSSYLIIKSRLSEEEKKESFPLTRKKHIMLSIIPMLIFLIGFGVKKVAGEIEAQYWIIMNPLPINILSWAGWALFYFCWLPYWYAGYRLEKYKLVKENIVSEATRRSLE